MQETHCCFNTSNQTICSARIHIPIAKLCTMGCIYCNYTEDKNITKEFRPGASCNVISKQEIHKYLDKYFKIFPEAEVIGVSGPGEPFDNVSELNELAQIMLEYYPNKKLCICTNGKHFNLFNDFVTKYKNVLHYITITLNSFDVQKIMQIYDSVQNLEQAQKLLESQLNIINIAQKNGIKTKINTVFISQINSMEIVDMFMYLKNIGVNCFNVLPQVKSGNKKQLLDEQENKNYKDCINKLKELNIPLTKQCNRCRSDFCGY